MTAPVRLCTKPEFDPELWFADPGTRERALAIRTCAACPFRYECAEQAMTEEFGVFGGIPPEAIDRAASIRKMRARERKAHLAAQRAEIVALTADGMSKAEIAAKLGVSDTTVARIRRAA